MWPWLLSCLACGSSIVLFDGSPFKPDPYHLWDFVEEVGVTIFGTSAKYLQHLQESSIVLNEKYKLSKLKAIYSTGSPLRGETFSFVYSSIKSDLLLASITGGTDIISLFAGMNWTLPVYRGEIQAPCLGMKIESWSDKRQVLHDAAGDLVCTKPFPCMPVYFLNDKNNELYMNAYFKQFPGIWAHGDFVIMNSQTMGLMMLGRSDGTLNPAGVRFGSAELYNIVQTFPEVSDSLAVGQKRPEDDDERVFLFLKMAEGHEMTESFVSKLKLKIRTELSPRHVPAFVLPTDDIPHTVNGKKVEIAVKNILCGRDNINFGSLANPKSLEYFRKIFVEIK